MFNKLKHIQDLRHQAKNLKSIMSDEVISVEKNETKLIVDGNFQIKELKLNPELSAKAQEEILISLFNEAIKKIQRQIAMKMQSTGDMPKLF